jgi:hypothetical protein
MVTSAVAPLVTQHWLRSLLVIQDERLYFNEHFAVSASTQFIVLHNTYTTSKFWIAANGMNIGIVRQQVCSPRSEKSTEDRDRQSAILNRQQHPTLRLSQNPYRPRCGYYSSSCHSRFDVVLLPKRIQIPASGSITYPPCDCKARSIRANCS